MWLQFFFPIYLIIIAITIIVASRYSLRLLRLTFSRSLPVLATLFLLSYTGILRTTLTVLFSYSTITHLPSGHKQMVWSIDASVPLFGFKFIMLFISCLLLFLLLIPFNIILLFTRYLTQFNILAINAKCCWLGCIHIIIQYKYTLKLATENYINLQIVCNLFAR